VVLSVLPIVEVDSWLVFGLKIGGTVAIANLIGAALYLLRRRRGLERELRAG